MLKTSTVSLQYVSVLSSLLRTEQLLWKKKHKLQHRITF